MLKDRLLANVGEKEPIIPKEWKMLDWQILKLVPRASTFS